MKFQMNRSQKVFLQIMGASGAMCVISLVLCYRILGDEPDKMQTASACPPGNSRVMVALEDRHGH